MLPQPIPTAAVPTCGHSPIPTPWPALPKRPIPRDGDCSPPARPCASLDDIGVVARLRTGDEGAFADLLDRYHTPLLRLASLYVADHATAEELVQDTWLAVLQGLDRFEERCSLKTWLCRILTNRAKTRAVRERRSAPFSAFRTASPERGDTAGDTSIDPDRFITSSPDRDRWASLSRAWAAPPEERLLDGETRQCIRVAVAMLPTNQRTVVTLRDGEGWAADEVCAALAITAGHQRVLLHRARTTVRGALEAYFAVV